ncbi:MAG: hypothetical protein ABI576_05960 [Flavobacterium sp.]
MDLCTLLQLIIVSILATSAMTLFSYAMSESFRELYKEPVLLTFLLIKMNLEVSVQTKKYLAWLLHYFIGFLFVLAYHILWFYNILYISVLSAFLLGIASGIIGIIGWVIMFKIADYKPKIDFKGYYIQLFFAHIIFAVIATAAYYLLSVLSVLGNAYAS